MRKLFLVFLLAVGFSMQGVCMNEEVQRRRPKKVEMAGNMCMITRGHIDIDAFVQVYVDADFLTLSFLVSPRDENVVVQISDPQGDVVYTGSYRVEEAQAIAIPIGDMNESEGEFLLEVTSGDGYLYGRF